MPELVLKLGDTVVQTYVFDKDIMSIGRSRDNDVVVENLSVSRNHARIRHQGGKYILTDLNSANGTYVNGVRVTKTELYHDDVISIGKHKLAFHNKVAIETPEAEELIGGGGDRTMLVEPGGKHPLLVVTEGKLKGREFPLTKFETSIGKAPGNDIVVSDDWFLSKKQLVIYKRGNSEFELHDLGGIRKSKINGEQIGVPHLLRTGDIIEFGNTKCMFQVPGEVPVGRVPQELPPEESIFSSGSASIPDRPVSGIMTERDEESGAGRSRRNGSAVAAEQSSSGLAASGSGAAVLEESHSSSNGSAAFIAKGGDNEGSSAIATVLPSEDSSALDKSLDSIPVDSGKRESLPSDDARPGVKVASSSGGGEGEERQATASAVAAALPDPSDPTVAREIAMWEAALQNRSTVIRKQAAKMLKKLTGRDYEL